MRKGVNVDFEQEMSPNASQSIVEPENEILHRSDRMKKQPKRLDSYVIKIPKSIDHSQSIIGNLDGISFI